LQLPRHDLAVQLAKGQFVAIGRKAQQRICSVERSDMTTTLANQLPRNNLANGGSGVEAETIRSGFASACKKAEITCGQTKAGGITWHDLRHNLSTSNSQYVYGEEPHRLAGRRVAHELTSVSAGEEKARGDFIAAHQQVFDRAMEVGHGHFEKSAKRKASLWDVEAVLPAACYHENRCPLRQTHTPRFLYPKTHKTNAPF